MKVPFKHSKSVEKPLKSSLEPARRHRTNANEAWELAAARRERAAAQARAEAFQMGQIVARIRAVLPHVTDREATRAYRLANNNIDAAIWSLLDANNGMMPLM